MECDLTVVYYCRVENVSENDDRLFAACLPGQPLIDDNLGYDETTGLRHIIFEFESKRARKVVMHRLMTNAEQTSVPYSLEEDTFEFLGNQGRINQ
jgi:hypothetical protein